MRLLKFRNYSVLYTASQAETIAGLHSMRRAFYRQMPASLRLNVICASVQNELKHRLRLLIPSV